MPRGGGRLLVLSSIYGLINEGDVPHTHPLLVMIKGRGHRDSRHSCKGVVRSNHPMGLLMFHLKYFNFL